MSHEATSDTESRVRFAGGPKGMRLLTVTILVVRAMLGCMGGRGRSADWCNGTRQGRGEKRFRQKVKADTFKLLIVDGGARVNDERTDHEL